MAQPSAPSHWSRYQWGSGTQELLNISTSACSVFSRSQAPSEDKLHEFSSFQRSDITQPCGYSKHSPYSPPGVIPQVFMGRLRAPCSVSSIKRKMGREWRVGLLRVVSVQGRGHHPRKGSDDGDHASPSCSFLMIKF